MRETDPKATRGWRDVPWASVIVVGLVTWLAFRPALDGAILSFDDDATLRSSESRWRGFGGAELEWMFTTFHMGHYQPLTWLSFAVDHAIAGDDPRQFHRTNLLLHVANALLVLALARDLLRRRAAPGAGHRRDDAIAAAAAALFFSVHPLRVESVAWITERRDGLATFFLLITVILWLRVVDLPAGRARRRLLIVTLIAFVASLLAKAWGITLPFVLLLLDVEPLRRLERGTRRSLVLVREKLPFFLFAAPFVVTAAAAQRAAGATVSLDVHPAWARCFQAAYGLCSYVGRTLWPFDLAPLYPLEARLDPTRLRYLASIAVCLVGVALLLRLARRGVTVPAVAAAAFVVVVAPVLGFTQAGPQIAADRYTYVATIPFAMLVAAAVRRGRRTHARATVVAAVIVVSGLAFLTERQCRVWRNDLTLWTHGARVQPDSGIARYNLARALLEAGRVDESIGSFERAVELDPNNVKYLQDAGAAHARLGRYAEAESYWTRILRRLPDHVEASFSMGLSAERQGRRAAARRWYETTLQADPDYAAARSGLARLGR